MTVRELKEKLADVPDGLEVFCGGIGTISLLPREVARFRVVKVKTVGAADGKIFETSNMCVKDEAGDRLGIF